MECDGSIINDSDSPLNGLSTPNLNSQRYNGGRGRYLRGGESSGIMNNSSRYLGNALKYSFTGMDNPEYYGAPYGQWLDTENGMKRNFNSADNDLDLLYVQVTAMTVVFIMRVK